MTSESDSRRSWWSVVVPAALAALSLGLLAGVGTAASLIPPATPVGRGIAQAGREGKYSFVLFYRANDRGSEAMRNTFAQAKGRLASKAEFFTVDINSQADAELVNKYRARQAPMPLTLVFAPNAAIVTAFTKPVDEATLAGSFVSEATASLLGGLQEQKVVALCLQNSSTAYSRESKRAAEGLAAERKLNGQVVVVVADPNREGDLLKKCGIKNAPSQATVVLLTPPGTVLGTFPGATTKDALLQKLTSASSPCSSGSCGPGGCGK